MRRPQVDARHHAVLQPHGVVLDEARAVADELGLPQWWLNEQASAYVAPGGDAAAPRVFDHPGLRVSAASPEHLLAMKALAARRRDADDIRFLIERLNLSTVEEVLALCAEVFRTRKCRHGLAWSSKTPSATDEILVSMEPGNTAPGRCDRSGALVGVRPGSARSCGGNRRQRPLGAS